MPTDRPSATELLAAVRQHLADKTAPLLQGYAAFHLRVAINALMIVERTLADGAGLDREELARLSELLAEPLPEETPADLQVREQLMRRNRQLAQQIRAGDWDSRADELLRHLRQTAADKLRLANPGYTRTRG